MRRRKVKWIPDDTEEDGGFYSFYWYFHKKLGHALNFPPEPKMENDDDSRVIVVDDGNSEDE